MQIKLWVRLMNSCLVWIGSRDENELLIARISNIRKLHSFSSLLMTLFRAVSHFEGFSFFIFLFHYKNILNMLSFWGCTEMLGLHWRLEDFISIWYFSLYFSLFSFIFPRLFKWILVWLDKMARLRFISWNRGNWSKFQMLTWQVNWTRQFKKDSHVCFHLLHDFHCIRLHLFHAHKVFK